MPETRKKKIDFWTLFEKFKFKVIRHFLVTTIWTILLSFVLAIVSNIISPSRSYKEISGNYALLLPEKLQKIFPALTKEKFIVLGLVLIFIYAFVFYFSSLWEEELRIRGGHYVKNCLLDKFRELPFEERQVRSKEINTLVEFDSGEVGYTWEHLPNHVYHSLLTIILILWFRWENFSKMSDKEAIFSFFWLTLISVVGYLFTRIIIGNEKKHKEELTKEWTVINKETEKAALIDSMGLTTQYKDKQRKITQKNENLLLSFNRAKSLNKTIPFRWLGEAFPYLLLLISISFEKAHINILAMWMIYENSQEIFRCFWEYGEYASSLTRINDFLKLPEKNDNLQGIVFPEKVIIRTVDFENVSFKYRNGPEWIIKNYTHSFTRGEINRLLGENGIGKSTILYLILGMIQPQQGKILITTEDGKIYNIQNVNLKQWRETKVAYASHDNLIEKGSTGQRQLANISQLFATKTEAAIFLFDEADNALDKDNQKKFSQRLEKLSKNKLVIYTKH